MTDHARTVRTPNPHDPITIEPDRDPAFVVLDRTGMPLVLHRADLHAATAPAPAVEDRDALAADLDDTVYDVLDRARQAGRIGDGDLISVGAKLTDAVLAWFAARQPAPVVSIDLDSLPPRDNPDPWPWGDGSPAPTVSAEQVEGIVRRVQEQRFTDDEGNDVGTMRPIEARVGVVHTLAALGIEVSRG